MMCHVLSTQVYLLDDPLAAVDNHVAAWLTEHVLGPRGLLAGKLRLVATSQLEVARDASQILVLRDGEAREHRLPPHRTCARLQPHVCTGCNPVCAEVGTLCPVGARARRLGAARGARRRLRQASRDACRRARRCRGGTAAAAARRRAAAAAASPPAAAAAAPAAPAIAARGGVCLSIYCSGRSDRGGSSGGRRRVLGRGGSRRAPRRGPRGQRERLVAVGATCSATGRPSGCASRGSPHQRVARAG